MAQEDTARLWGLRIPGRERTTEEEAATQEGPAGSQLPSHNLSLSLLISGYFPAENFFQIGDCSYC